MISTARASPKAVSGNQKLHHAMGHDLARRLIVKLIHAARAGLFSDFGTLFATYIAFALLA